MANGRENRECKKSKKQLRKRRTTLCNGKGSHPSWGLERSATSVSHQDSGIKTLTNPHSYPHLSLSSTSTISPLVFSLFNQQQRRSRPQQVLRTSPPGEPADSETRCVPQGRVQMCFIHAVSCADLYVVPGISTLRLWPWPRWGRNQWREPEGGGPASSVEFSTVGRPVSTFTWSSG